MIKYIKYISNISKRAIYDIENGEFDSAITKARTLLEEVFCNVIEEKNETPSTSGNNQPRASKSRTGFIHGLLQ